jgi:hypothetical protein
MNEPADWGYPDFQLMDNLNMTAYNIVAQTIRKNIYVPYDVLEIIFVVTIYQKWKIF